jgi:hypothetical protein
MYTDHPRTDQVVHPSIVHEVLEQNHRLLGLTRAENTRVEGEEPQSAIAPTMVRFDVRQVSGGTNYGECRLDLKAAIKALASTQHNAEGRTSTHIVIQKMWIEAGVNTTDVDVSLSCKQHNRIHGNFQRTSLAGASNIEDNPHKLFVLHAGVNRSCTPPALVHSASPFCDGQVFRDFHLALSGPPFEQHVSQIAGTQHVEFVAPDLEYVNGVFEGKGNWVFDILGNNLMHSEQPFAVHFSSIIDADGQDTGRQRVSIRMSKNDWKALRNAITNGIIRPLGEEIIDLVREPYLDFVILPDVDHLPSAKPLTAMGRLTLDAANTKNAKEAWQRVEEHEKKPWKVAFTAVVELNFVKFASLA